MGGRENLDYKIWFENFVIEFRRRYNDLPENTRKFVGDIDNFNAPCQLISLVLKASEFTYLWIRKDLELPDMDFRCFGPINLNEFIETSEEILSGRDLYKRFKEGESANWFVPSFGNFLEEHLIWVLKMEQNMLLVKANFPIGHVIGIKNFIPQNGFFWMVYGDITKIDVELILKEIFQGAYEMEKAQKTQIDKVIETQINKEELFSGYSTYFYPPAWIGEKPIFDFRSKATGIFTFPLVISKIEYKNSTLIFNQKGRFFVGINDRLKCIKFMNEIIGTAILLGYNFDVITDLDIGETTVTKDKGDKRSQIYPKSITTHWQAVNEDSPITEDSIETYTQITFDEILRLVKTAESASVDDEISNHIVFYAHASQYVKDGKYQESFLFDWLIIERYLRSKWDSYLDNKSLDKKRKKRLNGWNINYVLEQLALTEDIDQKMYENVFSLKDIRNSLYHKGEEVKMDSAIKCHEISELIIRQETNIQNSKHT